MADELDAYLVRHVLAPRYPAAATCHTARALLLTSDRRRRQAGGER